MQYWYGAVQKPLIRCFVRFGGHVDDDALKRAIDLSAAAVPQLGCCFDGQSHCWRKRGFRSGDMLHTVEAAHGAEEAARKALLSPIDFAVEPPLKVFLLKGEKQDGLCIIISHLVSDGGGFKQYLYLLAGLYSRCRANPAFREPPAEPGKRNLNQLLQNLSFRQKETALRAKTGSSKQDPAMRLPLDGDLSNPLIEIRRIEPDVFSQLTDYARAKRVSVNDLFLTAYARALYRTTGCRDAAIPCPVDLRKYRKEGQTCGICNLTGNYTCRVTVGEEDSFEATLNEVSRQMRTKKKSTACLKGPMLYHVLFHLAPFWAVQKLFYKISPVPVTSYTNLGILDLTRFRFGDLKVEDAFLSTAVKRPPYFQVSVSTCGGRCTLTSSIYGTERDRKTVALFLGRMTGELESVLNR